MEKKHRIPTLQIFQVDEFRVFFSAFEVVHFATATWCFGFWKKLPIFHASKIESPTSVSHGIQRSKFTFNPQLASAKSFLPDWASTLKALTRRMPLRVMAFLEAKSRENSGHDELPQNFTENPSKLRYICINFDPPQNW